MCVLVCGLLAVDAAEHLAEARSIEIPPAAPPVPSRAAPPVTLSKDGEALAERNMFCSDCRPAVAEPSPGEVEIARSALPLDLLATNVAGRAEHSFATLRHRDSGHQGAYGVGDVIAGAGTIERIGGRSIDVRNRASGQLERIELLSAAAPAVAAASPPSARTGRTTARAGAAVEGIRQLDDTTYEVDRSLITGFMTNPAGLGGARARPVQRDGQLTGFQIFGVRPNTPVAAIGLQNGDRVEAINGLQPRSPDEMLSVYTKLQTAPSVTLSIARRGQNVEYTYRLR